MSGGLLLVPDTDVLFLGEKEQRNTPGSRGFSDPVVMVLALCHAEKPFCHDEMVE